MFLFQEKLIKFLSKGLASAELSEEEYRLVLEALQKAGKITTVHPELYKGLLEDALRELPKLAKRAEGSLQEVREALKDIGIEVLKVDREDGLMNLEAVGSDASSNPMPTAMAMIALVGGIALREPQSFNPSIARDIIIEDSGTVGSRTFKFYYQVKAESLIPIASLKQLEDYEAPECLVVDGPLSASSLLIRVPYRKGLKREVYKEVQDSAHRLIRLRDELIKACKDRGVKLFSVVKRCTSKHFLSFYDLKDKLSYTDQYLFHQSLNYGERTNSISISKAIEKQGAPTFARYCEIYGFYIKTSRNVLTPPIRVEYPEYLRDEEDWIAKYVISTALTTQEPEFDGLPKVQCIAHRDVRIASRIMKEIYRRALTKALDEGLDVRLLGYKWGFGLGE